jgi:hypothetical protein
MLSEKEMDKDDFYAQLDKGH